MKVGRSISSKSLLLGTIAVLLAAGVVFGTWKVKTDILTPLPSPDTQDALVVQDPGALIAVTMSSTVGIILDEIPEGERAKLVAALLKKPSAYWNDLATRQVRYTTLRRNYGTTYGEKSLPLPPEETWQVGVTGDPKRHKVDGHDAVTVPYDFSATLLTDTVSPGVSQAVLGSVGGVWEDQLTLPLDPWFVFQRTGFACMNESESPPNSIDAEEADFYFDQKCHVEEKLSNVGCHQTQLVTESCKDAVRKHIGTAAPTMRFERVAWNAALAGAVRIGTRSNDSGPDLMPIQERLQEHRFTYRYIPENSCTLEEKCVGGPGWRQLLVFPTGDVNVGAKALDIGRVDYFHQTGGSLLSTHGVYEYSACHQHYHFSYYGAFSLGTDTDKINHKQAFCLQPTARVWNNEASPLNHPYSNCIDQGVAVGWIDEYNMGLECQWLDVTDITKNKPATLGFVSNPDGMMCEGDLKFDDKGKQLFQKTDFKTKDGHAVDKPQCNYVKGWDENNAIAYDVWVPETGEGYVTEPCGHDEFGVLRNCGLQRSPTLQECDPGSTVTLTCNSDAAKPMQIVRVCEGSNVLGTTIPCTYNDALASNSVRGEQKVTFVCPAARDEKEVGGRYGLLTGALFPEEGTVPVRCVPEQK